MFGERRSEAEHAPAAGGVQSVHRSLDLLETVAGRPAYLALLVQYPAAFRRVLSMIGQAKWAADYLTRHPILLDELLDDRGGIDEPAHLAASLDAKLEEAAGDTERQLDILRETHHAQLFRLLALDLASWQ